MRVKIFLAILAVIVIATLGAVAMKSRHRSAPIAEPIHETRSVSGFNRIKIEGLAEVTLRQGTREGVSVEGAPGVETHVRNGTLEVSVGGSGHLSDWFILNKQARSTHIVIDVININRIESAGAVKLNAASIRSDQLDLDFAGACSLRIDDLQATHLHLDGSGAVMADIAGAVDTQDVDLSGAGSYQAPRLVSNRAVIRVSGAGKAFVNVKTFLKVDLSGASAVEYLGEPKIEQDVTGISKVVRRDAP